MSVELQLQLRVGFTWNRATPPMSFFGAALDRFYSLPRAGAERKGSGLGLCFAREAVELHGGRLSMGDRIARSGAVFVIELPIID